MRTTVEMVERVVQLETAIENLWVLTVTGQIDSNNRNVLSTSLQEEYNEALTELNRSLVG